MVSCELHDYGVTVTAALDFDRDADPGEERSYKIGSSDEIIAQGDKVSIYAQVSTQPLFYVLISAAGETEEVEVGADHVDFVNVMGGSSKATGVCSFQ